MEMTEQFEKTARDIGKVNADRIARSAAAPEGRGPEPPDDEPPQSPRPVVRRITLPSRDAES